MRPRESCTPSKKSRRCSTTPRRLKSGRMHSKGLWMKIQRPFTRTLASTGSLSSSTVSMARREVAQPKALLTYEPREGREAHAAGKNGTLETMAKEGGIGHVIITLGSLIL